MSTHLLYSGEIKIDFKENPWHTYSIDGKRLTSVTSITGLLDKSAPLMYWAVGLSTQFLLDFLSANKEQSYTAESLEPVILEAAKQHTIRKEAAATIGDQVHKFAETHMLYKLEGGEKPSVSDLPKEVMAGINGFLDWFNSKSITDHKTERVVYSRGYSFVGKTDLTATIDGKRTVLDYKTANGIYPEHLFQLCLYWVAAEEEDKVPFEQGIIVRFDKSTGEFHEYIVSRDLYLHASAVALDLLGVKKGLEMDLVKDFFKNHKETTKVPA